ncbi:peptidase S24 [Larkinella punicea]|uniref:Peptidase S24 n=2 Tax=Larkinella punicea TaxID=2315727 RepID=A0A368JKV3_9BACT|nr:peptidase S24 [Larkinella punicea]
MIVLNDRIRIDDIRRIVPGIRLKIPLFSSYVAAGFPSPAENYIEKVCDLNDLCILNAEATYFVRVGSDSMSGDRIEAGDILVVDCSLEPVGGRIVVVWLNGDHVVKRIRFAGEMIVLESSNPKYLPIYVHPGEDFKVFGVVTRVIMKPV